MENFRLFYERWDGIEAVQEMSEGLTKMAEMFTRIACLQKGVDFDALKSKMEAD